MRFSLRRALTKMLVDSHLWVALAATGLTLFAQNFLGMPLVWYPAALVFASTMLIYEVDELFDRLASKSSARIGSRPWLGVGSACLYTGGVALCLNAAPSAVCYLVLCGAVPCLLYGAPVAVFNGTRMRELPLGFFPDALGTTKASPLRQSAHVRYTIQRISQQQGEGVFKCHQKVG